MPRRSAAGLADVAAWDNLSAAFWRAAKGKRGQPEVGRFAARLEDELANLRRRILAAELPAGAMSSFEIRDPKPRLIHAPCFRHRVLHHALMHHMAPVIERSLVTDTYACIPGRGSLAAVQRARQHTWRHAWYAKIDIAAYFASIEHARLLDDLARRFKDRGLLRLCRRIVEQHSVAPGCGLPIGALTSQHFANLYLAPVDRYLLEQLRVGSMVRYMDDILWWGDERGRLREQLDAVIKFAATQRGLAVKPTWQINRSLRGVPFCGFRVYPQALRLSRRRRRRYRDARRRWEHAYAAGTIGIAELQRNVTNALAITAHADAAMFRRRELEARPAVDA